MFKGSIILVFLTLSSGNCPKPSDYTYLGQKYYKLNNVTKYNFSEASLICEDEGAILAMPKTKEEHEHWMSLASAASNEQFYLIMSVSFTVPDKSELN